MKSFTIACFLLIASSAFAQSEPINMAWTDNATNEDGFRIERANASTGPWSVIVSLIGANLVSYTDFVTKVEGQTWCYRIKAYNKIGESTPSNVACKMFPVETAPKSPSGLTLSALSSSQIQASWLDNSGDEESFKMTLRTSSPPRTMVYSAAANTNNMTIGGLQKNKTHCGKIVAVRSGVESLPSNDSCATTRR